MQLLVDRLTAAGLTDVTLTVQPGPSRDLHRTNRDEVVADVVAWLDQRIGGQR